MAARTGKETGTFHPYLRLSTTASAATRIRTVTIWALRSWLIWLLLRGLRWCGRNRRSFAAADKREIEIAVLIDDQLFDFWQDSFHRLDVETMTIDLGRFGVLTGDFSEAGGVALGVVDHTLFIAFRLIENLLRLSARFGNFVVGITLRLIHDTRRVGARAGHVPKRVGGFRRRSSPFDIHGGEFYATLIIVQGSLGFGAHGVLNGNLLGGQDLIHAPGRNALGERGLDGRAHYLAHILCLKQVIHRYADEVLHDDAHVNNILIAGEELGEQRIGAAEHAIGDIAADNQALCLLDFQFCHAVDGPGEGEMNSGHDTPLHDRAETRHHGLLIGRDDIDAAQQPEHAENPRGALVARSRRGGFPELRLALHVQQVHWIPPSPFIMTRSSSESELRIAVVLSSKIFL